MSAVYIQNLDNGQLCFPNKFQLIRFENKIIDFDPAENILQLLKVFYLLVFWHLLVKAALLVFHWTDGQIITIHLWPTDIQQLLIHLLSCIHMWHIVMKWIKKTMCKV